jgi:hypothetical protein
MRLGGWGRTGLDDVEGRKILSYRDLNSDNMASLGQ